MFVSSLASDGPQGTAHRPAGSLSRSAVTARWPATSRRRALRPSKSCCAPAHHRCGEGRKAPAITDLPMPDWSRAPRGSWAI